MNNKKQKKLEKHIIRKVGKAIGDFNLIEPGDRIMLAFSGGKDSWTLLHVLKQLQKKAPIHYDIFIITIDPGFPGFQSELQINYLKLYIKNINYHIYKSNIYQVILNHRIANKSYCSFCSRLRRGILYRLAQKHSLNKIALAHHADDFIETLLLNQFFNGRIKSMSPLLHADDRNNTVIRPLCYVEEEVIEDFSTCMGFPILDSNCPFKEEKKMKRKKIKNIIAELESDDPGIKASLLSCLSKVDSRHLMSKDFLNI